MTYDIAIVLGSGWAKRGAWERGNVLSTTSLTGFVTPTVAGHSGRSLAQMATTNRAGGGTGPSLRRKYGRPGRAPDPHRHRGRRDQGRLDQRRGWYRSVVDPRHCRHHPDHINLTAASPLEDPHRPRYGSRFVDLTICTARTSRDREEGRTQSVRRRLRRLSGRTTRPGRDRDGRTMGATLVGMSTVLRPSPRVIWGEVSDEPRVEPRAGVTAGHLNHLEVSKPASQPPRRWHVVDPYRPVL